MQKVQEIWNHPITVAARNAPDIYNDCSGNQTSYLQCANSIVSGGFDIGHSINDKRAPSARSLE